MSLPGQNGSTGPLYIDSAEAADRFLASIAGTTTLALDTEGASFHRYVDRIYLLQLSTDREHAIIDPLKVESPSRLGALLESRDVEVVFHDADYDLRLLHQDYGWRVTNIFDTRVAAQLLGIKAFGLAALLEGFFGVRLDKKHQRADWSMRPLPGDMLEYAAQDTMHLLQLRQRLHDALETKGRLHWAREEFERLEGTHWEEVGEDTSFLRIKGARDLSRRELAILRELVAWRDGAAELELDPGVLCPRDRLEAIARKNPRAPDDLADIPELRRWQAEVLGGDFIRALGNGKPDDSPYREG